MLAPFVGAITTLSLLSPSAHADETVDPKGIGDLMPGADDLPPEGTGTLYEEYNNPNLWTLDQDLGNGDMGAGIGNLISDLLMLLVVTIGRAVTVLVGWLYELTTIPELSTAVEAAIGGAAQWVLATFFGTAFAVGAVAVYAKRKEAAGAELSEWGWLFASGVLAVSLLTTPGAWVSGVDTVRSLGSTVATKITTEGMDHKGTFPFELDHEPSYGGNTESEEMVRKSSDAVWRSYVAAPWCVANFGSIEVCERHAKDLLDQGADREDRKDWLRENVNNKGEGADGHVGEESVRWRQGKYYEGRIGLTAGALLAIVIFGAVVIILALAALFSLIGALMLLVMGVVFACLWCIPGRTREWGKKWFDFLLGFTLQSFMATMILGVVLILNSAIMGLVPKFGWLVCIVLSISVAITALKLRRLMETIVGVSGVLSGGGAAVGGYLALRGAKAAVGKAAQVGKNAGKMVGRNLPATPGGGGTGTGSGGGGPTPSGRGRPLPPPPATGGPQPAATGPGGSPATGAASGSAPPSADPAPRGRRPSRDVPPGGTAGDGRSPRPGPARPQPHDPERRLPEQRRDGARGAARRDDGGHAFRPVPAPGQTAPRVVPTQDPHRRPVPTVPRRSDPRTARRPYPRDRRGPRRRP